MRVNAVVLKRSSSFRSCCIPRRDKLCNFSEVLGCDEDRDICPRLYVLELAGPSQETRGVQLWKRASSASVA